MNRMVLHYFESDILVWEEGRNIPLEKYLEVLSCPFTWELQPLGVEFAQYLKKDLTFNTSFKHNFVVSATLITIAFEYGSHPNHLKDAMYHADKCYDIAESHYRNGSKLDYRALLIILVNMKIHILYRMGRYEDAFQLLTKGYSTFSIWHQDRRMEAFFNGYESEVRMFYRQTLNVFRALHSTVVATILEPECWYWQAQLLKILRHMRESKDMHAPVTGMELQLLKSLVDKTKSLSSILFLAKSYSRIHQFFPIWMLDEQICGNRRLCIARIIFLRLLQECHTFPVLIIVCNGRDYYLPEYISEINYYIACLKSISITLFDPRGVGIYHGANLCEAREREDKFDIMRAADSYGTIINAGNFDCTLRYINLMKRLHPFLDILPALRGQLRSYKRTDHQMILLLNIADLIFEKDMLREALDIFMEAISLDPCSPLLENFAPFTEWYHKKNCMQHLAPADNKVNIYKLVRNTILLLKEVYEDDETLQYLHSVELYLQSIQNVIKTAPNFSDYVSTWYSLGIMVPHV